MSRWIKCDECGNPVWYSIANYVDCKHMYDDVCCFDNSDFVKDYPSEEDCTACQHFEREDGIIEREEQPMKKYIGTKIIDAEPAQNSEGKDGYKVIYPDGYESWSPKEAFEETYRPIDGMNFGLALEAVKKGHKIARQGWNGWVASQADMLADDWKIVE